MKRKYLSYILILVVLFYFSIFIHANSEKFITVTGGKTTSPIGIIELDYNISASKFEVNIEDYLLFLNSLEVTEDGIYKEKEIINIDHYNCPIDYNNEKNIFYYKENDYTDSIKAPITHISWYGAAAYCNWLSKKMKLSPAYNLDSWELKAEVNFVEGFRLPTEEEWVYLAHGGLKSINYDYAGGNNLDKVGWYQENSKESIHIPGQKKGNELDIYDMSGNAKEWTNDTLGQQKYIYGGSWKAQKRDCRIAQSGNGSPESAYSDVGFRVIRTVK